MSFRFGTIGAGLSKSVQGAAELAETLDFSGVVFGDSIGDVEAYTDSLAESFGVVKNEAFEGMADMGSKPRRKRRSRRAPQLGK